MSLNITQLDDSLCLRFHHDERRLVGLHRTLYASWGLNMQVRRGVLKATPILLVVPPLLFNRRGEGGDEDADLITLHMSGTAVSICSSLLYMRSDSEYY